MSSKKDITRYHEASSRENLYGIRGRSMMTIKVMLVIPFPFREGKATPSNCGKSLKLYLPSIARKRRCGRGNDLGYGKNDRDVTMGNPQPSSLIVKGEEKSNIYIYIFFPFKGVQFID